MRFINDEITFSNTALSADRTSSAIDVSQLWYASFQVKITKDSAIAGTLKLQFSNDPPKAGESTSVRASDVSNWTDVPSATAAVSDSGVFGISLDNIGYQWVRVVYTRTSGDGTVNSARYVAKGV
jgi:hypothetical protein